MVNGQGRTSLSEAPPSSDARLLTHPLTAARTVGAFHVSMKQRCAWQLEQMCFWTDVKKAKIAALSSLFSHVSVAPAEFEPA
jgi:hypothetical protein